MPLEYELLETRGAKHIFNSFWDGLVKIERMKLSQDEVVLSIVYFDRESLQIAALLDCVQLLLDLGPVPCFQSDVFDGYPKFGRNAREMLSQTGRVFK